MAKGDITIREKGGAQARTWQVAAGAVGSLKAGEMVKRTGVGSPYVEGIVTGNPIASADIVVGIALGESTDTVAVDGTVEVLEVVAGKTVLEMKALDPTAVDTQAEIDALVGQAVLLNNTASVTTLDESTVTASDNGLIIVGGDLDRGTLFAVVKDTTTVAGTAL